MKKFSHYAMGTTFEIIIAGQLHTYAGQAAQAVFDEVDRLENILSRFNPCSETSQLNRLQPGQHLAVSIEMIACLNLAKQMVELTDGAFDVTGVQTGKRIEAHKFHEPCTVPEANRANQPYGPNRRGLEHLDFSKDGKVHFLPGNFDYPLHLDFGGIGKGFALDQVLHILSDWDIDSFLLHGGTSTVLAKGDAPTNGVGEQGWPVGLDGEVVYLDGLALSGSGKEVKGEHILDPRTGEPAHGHLSAWVFHPSAAIADALSTACMVMSPSEAAGFRRRHPHIRMKLKEYPA